MVMGIGACVYAGHQATEVVMWYQTLGSYDVNL